MRTILTLALLPLREQAPIRAALLVLAYLAALLVGDQALATHAAADRVPQFLSWGTTLALVAGFCVVLFTVSFQVPQELEYRQAAMVFSKPVRRIQFLLARLLGAAVLCFAVPLAGLLALAGAALVRFDAEQIAPRTLRPAFDEQFPAGVTEATLAGRRLFLLDPGRGQYALLRFEMPDDDGPWLEAELRGRLRPLERHLSPLDLLVEMGAEGDEAPRWTGTVTVYSRQPVRFRMPRAALGSERAGSSSDGPRPPARLWLRLTPRKNAEGVAVAAYAVEPGANALLGPPASLPGACLRAAWVSGWKLLVVASAVFAASTMLAPVVNLLVGLGVGLVGAMAAFVLRIDVAMDHAYPGLFAGVAEYRGRPVEFLRQLAATLAPAARTIARAAPDLSRFSLERTLVQGYDVPWAWCGEAAVAYGPYVAGALALAALLFARRDLA